MLTCLSNTITRPDKKAGCNKGKNSWFMPICALHYFVEAHNMIGFVIIVAIGAIVFAVINFYGVKKEGCRD